jgi:hypothetical protein
MEYVLLIHASEAQFDAMSEAEQSAIFAGHGAFTKELLATGRGRSGAALMPSATATCLRVRDGSTTLTDGPFAETKEQLGGYYGYATNEVEEAIAWAARIPDATYGSVEVRATPTFEGAPPSPPTAPKPTDATKEYLLLMYEDESRWASIPEAERNAVFGRYFAFSAETRRAGLFVDGAALVPTRDARTVRVRDGKRLVSDGPFAETKEQLGGYYRLWARDLDHVVQLAKQIPAAETGTIEIRPIMDTSQFE